MLQRSPIVPLHNLRRDAGGRFLPNRAEIPHLRHHALSALRHSSCDAAGLDFTATGGCTLSRQDVGGRSGAEEAVSHFQSAAMRISHLYHATAVVHLLWTPVQGSERPASSQPALAHLSAIPLPTQSPQEMVPSVTCENLKCAFTFTTVVSDSAPSICQILFHKSAPSLPAAQHQTRPC